MNVQRRLLRCSHHAATSLSAAAATTTAVVGQQQLRNNMSTTRSYNYYQIPAPSWSIASLELDQQHAPAGLADLEKLAKRAVIDMSLLDDGDNNNNNNCTASKERLCQDLGNMLHMMEQVQNFNAHTATANNATTTDAMDAVVLYDVPRGVTEAPCRDDDNDSNDDSSLTMSAAVRASLLEPKMTRVGAHQFFEIVTARQRGGNAAGAAAAGAGSNPDASIK